MTRIDKFINGGITFYQNDLRYLLTKVNVEKTFWNMTEWLDCSKTENARWSNIEYFMSQYSGILRFDDYEIKNVYQKIVKFKCLKQSELFPLV